MKEKKKKKKRTISFLHNFPTLTKSKSILSFSLSFHFLLSYVFYPVMEIDSGKTKIDG